MKLPRQCAILVGGLGTRLGQLTADTPKPLLDCGGRPFLAWVLRELSRFGIEEVVLLAGFKADAVKAFCDGVAALLPKPLSIKISVEPSPAGTGGALWLARDLLDESFLLINGDSWLDTNLAEFFAAAVAVPDTLAMVLLRSMEDCARYGRVELEGGRIKAFAEKNGQHTPGVINGGIYLLSKDVIGYLKPHMSLETDVLPVLAAEGILGGKIASGYFIDIGIPEDYERAGRELPARLRRPAVFFDRDGVLNEDHGWVGSADRFQWMAGAKAAVKAANDSGFHVFVVTNQAGIAKGYYTEDDVAVLHKHIAGELLESGATLDDIRYCPQHPDATVERYRGQSDWRKPGPGMINDLIEKWDVDRAGSFLVGDKDWDIQAARAAGIPGHLFTGGDLGDFVRPLLASSAEAAMRGVS